MKRFLTALFVAMFSAGLLAQATIDPSRRIDWSLAGAAAILTRTTICTTLSAGATGAAIDAAVAACPVGQVVKLGAGTFTITAGLTIARSDVTLRGSGANQTFLNFTGSNGCTGLWTDICVMNPAGGVPNSDNPGTVANWTAGYSVGTTTVTLSTVSGLAVGSMLVLDQLDDTDTDTGEIWVCQKTLICAPPGEGGAAGRPDRAQMQFVKVTGISGTDVTFSPGLYMPNWRIGRTPQAWWITPGERVGIEDLSMDHTAAGTTPQSGIFFINQRDSWIKNVRSINANRNHIWLYEDAHVTVRDSYFYGTQNAASQSYGIETRMGSDHLIENNIFQHITTPMMSGNVTDAVWGYNYAVDDYYVTFSNLLWQQASSYIHDAGVDHVLIEGNDGIGFNGDNLHGTSHFATMFRNYWNGRDPSGGAPAPGKMQQTSAVIAQATQRFHNYLGNVIGTSGYHTVYECFPASSATSTCTSNANRAIYSLGWSGNEGSKIPELDNDVLVRNTMSRWGNYDLFTNTARFVAAEVPTAIPLYAQPLFSTQVLAPSLYLSGVPSWYGTTWPPIGPDITTGELVSGHVNKIPARLCYESTSSTGGILNFDATNCYGSLRQVINVGVVVNDTSAEQIRSAFGKVNAMMVDLYRRLLPSGTALVINIGSSVNDRTAESIRSAFGKINTQAAQLASAGSVTVPTINTGAAVNDTSADTIRSAFTKVNTITATLYAAQPTTAYGPQATITCPAGAVTIADGASIQAAVTANAASTTFCVVGAHQITSSIVPKNGDVFVGQYGAYVDGTGWVSADPDAAAFKSVNQGIVNVTIRNLYIRNMPQNGVKSFEDSATAAWIVEYDDISLVLNTGVNAPKNGIVRHNKLHHCGNISGDQFTGGGYSAYQGDGALFETNEISYNANEQKIAQAANVTFRNNWVHHNFKQAGIWYDGGLVGALVENNVVEDNNGVAVDFEMQPYDGTPDVTSSNIIRNNVLRRNGDAGVLVSISHQVEIYGNTIQDNYRGITYYIDCTRIPNAPPPAPPNTSNLKHVYAHDNTIRVPASFNGLTDVLAGALSTAGGCSSDYVNLLMDLRWDYNAWTVPNTSTAYWLWDTAGMKTFAQWQALPQDTHGTVQ